MKSKYKTWDDFPALKSLRDLEKAIRIRNPELEPLINKPKEETETKTRKEKKQNAKDR